MKSRIMKPTAILAGLLLIPLLLLAQIPEKAEFGKFAITNATVHTVTGGVLENATVLINGEMIEFVGQNAKITDDYVRIEASGKHIYPGLIDAGTQLGLQEIGAVAVTRDQQELGDVNPHVMAFTAINPSSVNIPVTRVNGVTTVVSAPTGSFITGKATLIDLYGYAPDSMAVVPKLALHVVWPNQTKRGWWDDRKPKEIKKEYEKRLKMLNDFWDKAEFYATMMSAYEQDPKGKKQPDFDAKLDAMQEVVSGETAVMITVNKEKDIRDAIAWVEERGLEKVAFSSVAEGWRVADALAEAEIPCLVGPVLSLPSRDYENYQRAYQNAGMMRKAGVKIAIRTGEVENVRNLPYHAGYAATYGLGMEEALKAVTLYPAQIFGVDDQLGSIEKGKKASLIMTDGNPFEPMTNVEQVFIRGFKIPMTSRHSKLYEQYLNRDPRSK